MGELSAFLNRKGKMSTAILKCPSGRYTIVGSVPIELCVPDKKALYPGAMKCLVWETEQEAIDALLAIGWTKFQLANCKWYAPEQEKLPIETPQAIIAPVGIPVTDGKEAQEKDKSPNYNLFVDKEDRQINLF